MLARLLRSDFDRRLSDMNITRSQWGLIAVVARLGPDEKIPESERYATACCVCFALLQAAQGFGFGAQWLTGWPAYDAAILQLLGLSADERIAGFIHIGTAQAEAIERERPDPATLLTDWTPA